MRTFTYKGESFSLKAEPTGVILSILNKEFPDHLLAVKYSRRTMAAECDGLIDRLNDLRASREVQRAAYAHSSKMLAEIQLPEGAEEN